MNANNYPIIPLDVLVKLRAAADAAAKGLRDPERMKEAARRMDERADKNAKLLGVEDIGVEIIREMRDSR